MAQQSRRHHFIPQFFSRLWAGTDGKLCEYSRPHKQLVARRKAPKAVGFEFDLYSLPGAIPEDLAFLEDRFFATGDQRACDAVQALLTGKPEPLSADLRAAFTRLLISFHHRTPERVKHIREGLVQEMERLLEEVREEYRTGVRAPLPPGVTFEQVASNLLQETRDFSWGNSLMNLVNSDLVGPAIYSMRWATRRLNRSDHDLLLGDHPLVRSNGFAHAQGHIALPLGPRVLFLATNNVATERTILSQLDSQIVRDANRETLRHAKRFVYATGEQHAAFVDRRLGRSGY